MKWRHQCVLYCKKSSDWNMCRMRQGKGMRKQEAGRMDVVLMNDMTVPSPNTSDSSCERLISVPIDVYVFQSPCRVRHFSLTKSLPVLSFHLIPSFLSPTIQSFYLWDNWFLPYQVQSWGKNWMDWLIFCQRGRPLLSRWLIIWFAKVYDTMTMAILSGREPILTGNHDYHQAQTAQRRTTSPSWKIVIVYRLILYCFTWLQTFISLIPELISTVTCLIMSLTVICCNMPCHLTPGWNSSFPRMDLLVRTCANQEKRCLTMLNKYAYMGRMHRRI